MRLIAVILVLLALSCKKDDVRPDCERLQTGSVRVENMSRERYRITVGPVTAEIPAGGYLLVNYISAGPRKVTFVNNDGAGGESSIDVSVCETSLVTVG